MDDRPKILIIEDEIVIAQDMEEILSSLGYDVVDIISRSDKAIDYLSFNIPDLVLCDIHIKGEKDGIEVARIIGKTRRMPFVFVTSFADRNTLARAKLALPYGYIVKPFNEKDLHSSIEVALFKFQQEIESLKITHDRVNEMIQTDLTVKEYEVFSAIVRGATYSEMSQELQISQNTLKFHLKNIFQKFQVSRKAEMLQSLLYHLKVTS